MDAGHLVLGTLMAIRGTEDPSVYFLARALRECGSDSSYIDDIIRKNAAPDTTQPKETK